MCQGQDLGRDRQDRPVLPGSGGVSCRHCVRPVLQEANDAKVPERWECQTHHRKCPIERSKGRAGEANDILHEAFAEDEASISGTILILKLISEELGLSIGDGGGDSVDVWDKVVMCHGDYLTVRNMRYVAIQGKAGSASGTLALTWLPRQNCIASQKGRAGAGNEVRLG